MVITDSFFEKGSTHHVCQDYALHSTDYAIGSDGCSSSPNTDVGARLLCHTLTGKLKKYKGNNEVIRYAAKDAAFLADQMYLPKESLDATLFGFEVLEDKVRYFISGDGYIYKKYTNSGEIWEEVHSITFEQNMPFYPNYFSDLDRIRAFRQFGTKVTKTITYIGGREIKELSETWDASDFVDFGEESLVDLETLLMFSDGLGTFQLDKSDLDMYEVLKHITNFKSLSHGFLQRNMLNGLPKGFGLKKSESHRLTHWDDFSVVGLANV